MKRRMKFPRRFIYPSGLISLILLPIICIAYIRKEHKRRAIHCIEVNMATEEILKTLTEKAHLPYPIHPERNFNEIIITGNDTDDKIKLEYGRILLRDLLIKSDTINGIHYIFEDNAKYWTWIYAIEPLVITKEEEYRKRGFRFVTIRNEIWVYNYIYNEPEKSPVWVCGTHSNFIKKEEQKYKEWVNDFNKRLEYAKGIWPIFIILIILVLLSFKKWLK